MDRIYAVQGDRDPRLRRGAAAQVRQAADRLVAALGPIGPENPDFDTAVRRAALAAWPDRVAVRRSSSSDRARLVGGRGVVLSPASGVREAPVFLALQADDGAQREGTVYLASAIEEVWLPTTEGVHTVWDEERRQVAARFERRYGDLVLASRPAPLPSAAEVEARLVDVLRTEPSWIPRDREPLLGTLARLTAARRYLAGPFPDPEVALDAALPAAVAGRRGLDDVSPDRWAEAVVNTLPWNLRQTLDHEAPDRLVVPSGSNLPLVWRTDGPPILAVRIQEIFGWTTTPRVLGGKVAVTLHLLSPAHRPVQVTEDLASFWKNTWVEVRKELRARYPKHSWPEDPLTATAESRPRRRSS
jgi:ATP-dependent helicase HrpB